MDPQPDASRGAMAPIRQAAIASASGAGAAPSDLVGEPSPTPDLERRILYLGAAVVLVVLGAVHTAERWKRSHGIAVPDTESPRSVIT
jgi:hypothetical protein